MKKLVSRELRSSARITILSILTATFLMACGAEDAPLGSVSQAIAGEGHAWTHGDWSWRVHYEARYALSKSANGTSSSPRAEGGYYGDWHYVAKDWNAYFKAFDEAYGQPWVGTVGFGLGGECTFFVRLVLYRSTAWNFNDHYTTPNYTKSSMYDTESIAEFNSYPNQWQPGWILRGNSHFAIADQRAYNGGWGWWIIDSNWVGGQRIGKHFFTDNELANGGYLGWKPNWASYNQ